MREPLEVHDIKFFSVLDLHGRRVRLAVGVVARGGVGIALLREGEPLMVDNGTLVGVMAAGEVPSLQRELGEALVKAAERQD